MYGNFIDHTTCDTCTCVWKDRATVLPTTYGAQRSGRGARHGDVVGAFSENVGEQFFVKGCGSIDSRK